MKALVTGASSGIGRDMCVILSNMGYEIYGVARRSERLAELGKTLKTKFTPIALDISKEENCLELYEMLKGEKIDVLINNAGFGIFGKFVETDLQRDLQMIDTNVRSLHILTKLFVKKFVSEGSGKVLNVASSAGFMMGPFLSSYYASKAYVLRLSEAIDEEVRRECKNVTVSVLCPGPVKTEFDSVADVKFSLSGLESKYVAKYAIDKMMRGKRVIIPGFSIKLLIFVSRFVPGKILSKITFHIQKKKS